MKTFKGQGVSSGIAIAQAHIRESGLDEIPEYKVLRRDVEKEQKRLKSAIQKAKKQITQLSKQASTLQSSNDEEFSFLFDAYLQMLDNSRLVRGALQRIEDGRINAEAAVQIEAHAIAEVFTAMEDSYISARIEDIREVASRLIRNLTKNTPKAFSSVPKGSIVIADALSPADMAQIDPERVIAVACMSGGGEGHAAILARALGIPAVFGASNVLSGVKNGDSVIVDGKSGEIVVNPDKNILNKYLKRREELTKNLRRLKRLKDLPSVSRDGTDISLQANVELPMEIKAVKNSGAHGIGLLRSEFMFIGRKDIPGEEEQYKTLKSMIEAMNGLPVTIRTLDIGGEKSATAVLGELDDSAASALGMRGIRLSLTHLSVLETQFCAILRASLHGTVRILLPMVSNVSEVRKARAILKKAAAKLKRRGIKLPDKLPPIGIMIEVPGAALAADALAQSSDFFAIGSNDLTMYTLAVDRANEHVAHLFNPLHPAVLRLIQFSTAAALRARIPVSLCGEIAGDPRFTALLVGLGLRELSMAPTSIPGIKQRIRSLNLIAATQRAQLIMDQTDSTRISTLIDDFNELS